MTRIDNSKNQFTNNYTHLLTNESFTRVYDKHDAVAITNSSIGSASSCSSPPTSPQCSLSSASNTNSTQAAEYEMVF